MLPTVLEQTLRLEQIAFYAHSGIVDEATDVLNALRAGGGGGLAISIRPVDDPPWVIYAPLILEKSGKDTVINELRGIEGISEHSHYDRLPNSRANQITT